MPKKTTKTKKKTKKEIRAEEEAAAADLERLRVEKEEKERLRAEALDVASTVVEEDVVRRCASVLYEKYLQGKTVTYIARNSMDKLLSMLSAQSLTHPSSFTTKTDDANNKGTAPPTKTEGDAAWMLDEEPVPPPIDTWARGAIRVHKRTTKGNSKEKGEEEVEGGKRKKTRGSSKKSRGGLSFASAALAFKKKKSRRDHPSSVHTDATTPTSSTRIFVRTKTPKLPSRKAMEAMRLKREAQQKEEERRARLKQEREETEEERNLRHTYERINALKRRQAEEISRYESIAKDLSGKSYTFDRSGNVVMIRPLPKKRMLAPVAADVAIVSREEEGEISKSEGTEDDTGGDAKRRRNGRRRVKKSATTTGVIPRRPRVVTSVVSSTDVVDDGGESRIDRFFVEETHKQPPLTSSMRLSPGVNVRDGKLRRRGPRQSPTNPLRMTRSMFAEHQSRLVEMDSAFSFATMGGYPAAAGTSLATWPGDDRATSPVIADRSISPDSSRPGTFRSVASASSATGTIRDVDAFAGAREAGVGSRLDGESETEVEEDEDEDDENVLLTTAPDWGANPVRDRAYSPPLSVRHSPKAHTLQALGSRAKNPRDRRKGRDEKQDSRKGQEEEAEEKKSWATRSLRGRGANDVEEGRRNLGATAPASSTMRAATKRYFTKPSPGTITRTVSSDLARLL